ncbi:MAG: hypothetical protein AAFO07_10170 [Bacteroidota bacterium]
MEIAKFSFLPWVRQGIAARIKEEESFGEISGDFQARATVDLKLKVDAVPVAGNAYQDEAAEVIQNIQLFGPGEVIGIDRKVIVKTEPQANTTNFEPNYMPYVEFYEEDFPWRYTPAKETDSKLRPWLTLLVLETDEYKNKRLPGALLPAITNGEKDIPFPDTSTLWAWAHVHINKTLDQSDGKKNSTQLDTIIKQEDANLASSRLLCSRRLKANTKYQAFLVPSFEQGRLSALGASNERILEEDVRKSAWDEHKEDEFAGIWPYYFEWSFTTGEELDFEYLVRLIDPRVLDDDMGRRPMDCSDAGYLIKYEAGSGDRQGVLDLEGALQSPIAECNQENFLESPDDETETFLKELKKFLNLSLSLKEENLSDTFYINELNQIFDGDEDGKDDPIVLPPRYGKWHAEEENKTIDYDPENPSQSDANYWYYQANLDPRNRAAAGLGTRIVQKDQEKYMDDAWGQVGEVLKAIRKLKRADLSIEVSKKLLNKFISSLNPAAYANITSMIHQKINFDNSQTFAALTASFDVSQVYFNRSFGKLSRPNGPAFKRSGATQSVGSIASGLQNNFINHRSVVNVNEYSSNLFNYNNVRQRIGDLDITIGGFGSNINNGIPIVNIDLGLIGGVLERLGIGGFGIRNLNNDEPALIASITSYLAENNWNPNFDGEKPTKAVQLDLIKQEMGPKINPQTVITKKAWKGISFVTKKPPISETEVSILSVRNIPVFQAAAPPEIVDVLAYPEFKDPMYIALKEFDESYFLPGIERIPDNTFSILVTNQRFIESYLLGLNHEMARELLWREYPTDQKGSYFRKFWEQIKGAPEALEYDINEITSWANNALGKNRPLRNADDEGDNDLVFVVKGELLKRFPDTVIYLQRGRFILDENDNPTTARTLDLEGDIKWPAFGAELSPDITFKGFNVTAKEANGDIKDGIPTDPGYFIVVKERAGEPRFGLDLLPEDPDDLEDPSSEAFTWNDGNWTHMVLDENGYIQLNQGAYNDKVAPIRELTQDEIDNDIDDRFHLQWGKNAAHMAGILYQLPYMVAIHADVMISDDIEDC